MKVLPTILVGATAAGLIWGIRYYNNLRRTEKKTAVVLGVRAPKLSWKGLELVVEFNILNPGNEDVIMAKPLIKFTHKGSQLGTSSYDQMDIPDAIKTSKGHIRIPRSGETGIISTPVLLPIFSLAGAGANLVAILEDRLKGGSKVAKFDVEVNTTIFAVGGIQVPYDDKQVIAI